MDIPVADTYQRSTGAIAPHQPLSAYFLALSPDGRIRDEGAFVRDAILPSNPEAPEQLPLWQERVRLDEGFYQSLIDVSATARSCHSSDF